MTLMDSIINLIALINLIAPINMQITEYTNNLFDMQIPELI